MTEKTPSSYSWKLSMHRRLKTESYEVSIWWLIIMVILLSGIVGVSIPLMSGGLPRSQGDAQITATPTHSQPLAIRAETPAVLAEAAGRSDGTVGQSSKSTPVVPAAAHIVSSTPTATSPVLAQRPKRWRVLRFARFCRCPAGRNSIPNTLCRPVNPDCVLDRCCCAAERNTVSYKYVITHGNHYFSFRRDGCVTCKAHSEPATTAIPDAATHAD